MSGFAFEPNGKLKLPTDAELAAQDANSAILAFSHGQAENGQPYWAYIAVKPSLYRQFRDLTGSGQPIRLGDYGDVLASGLAESPPEDVIRYMRETYHFDTEFKSKLVSQFKNEQEAFMKQKEQKRIDDIVMMLKMKKPG